ncbi:replication/maintenance protein RepL [Capnocytophaga canis]|uniref:replication/maintenance protein RepL n=1 Tax=Capnocytophaga canis TaxID=1848903 RepID=UPI0037D57FDB
MKQRKKKVRYLKGIDTSKSNEQVTIPLWKTEHIETDYVNFYVNSLVKLWQVSATAQSVLLLACQEMDCNNFIINNLHFKTILNSLLKKAGYSPYQNNTINKCFTELTQVGLLIKKKYYGKGIYRVSPQYFFKGSQDLRIKLVREVMEEDFKNENNKIRHQCLKIKGKLNGLEK